MKNRPPENLNPENFVIGQTSYDPFVVAVATNDDNEFRLHPAPVPLLSMILNSGLWMVAVAGFIRLFSWSAGRFGEPPLFAYIIISLIGGIGCFFHTLFPWFRFRYEQRHGTWLAYDKTSRRVRLPRHAQEFGLREIVYLQYVTTKKLEPYEKGEEYQLTELNLVTCKDGERKRWPLLKTSSKSRDAFGHLLRLLIQSTEIPVVRFRDSRRGWEVTVEPYN